MSASPGIQGQIIPENIQKMTLLNFMKGCGLVTLIFIDSAKNFST